MLRKSWVPPVGLVLALAASAVLAGVAAAEDAGAQKELDAIQKVIEQSVAATNDPKLSAMSLADRTAQGRRHHRPDASYGSEGLPIYFGGRNAPVVRGAEAYIKTSLESEEAYRKAGYTFKIQLGELQIKQDGNLAFVVATPNGVVTAPDGKTVGGAPARWTVVLQKAADGNWYIIHEHLSFYNAADAAAVPVRLAKGE